MSYDFKDNTFTHKDKSVVELEVGDAKQPDTFYPQVKFKKWDNECNMSFRLLADRKNAKVKKDGDTIKWKNGKTEARFYTMEAEELDTEDGGVEFEVVLYENPKTNKIEFSIRTKGFDFHYQPGPIGENVFRPIDVVGSYAVYHTSKSNNEYKTGKAFHIFRPHAIDDCGKFVWCEIYINTENKLATITIPQEFLNNATYPVVVDPTFGYTSIGASLYNQPGSGGFHMFGSVFTYSHGGSSAAFIADKMYIYGNPDVHGTPHENCWSKPIILEDHTTSGTLFKNCYSKNYWNVGGCNPICWVWDYFGDWDANPPAHQFDMPTLWPEDDGKDYALMITYGRIGYWEEGWPLSRTFHGELSNPVWYYDTVSGTGRVWYGNFSADPIVFAWPYPHENIYNVRDHPNQYVWGNDELSPITWSNPNWQEPDINDYRFSIYLSGSYGTTHSGTPSDGIDFGDTPVGIGGTVVANSSDGFDFGESYKQLKPISCNIWIDYDSWHWLDTDREDCHWQDGMWIDGPILTIAAASDEGLIYGEDMYVFFAMTIRFKTSGRSYKFVVISRNIRFKAEDKNYYFDTSNKSYFFSTKPKDYRILA